MDPFLIPWIQINLFLQSLGSWPIGIMKFFTFLGNEEFYLLVAPAILWCLDTSLGMRVGLLLMTSSSINGIVKLIFHAPRPYWLDLRVQPYSAETSFGIPSGHAQNAVVVWGALAAWVNKTWAWIAALIVIFMISISRLYLGVHFMLDTLAGWLIGGLILWAWLHYERRVVAYLRQRRVIDQVLVVLAASLALILAGVLARIPLGSWSIPEAWQAGIARVHGAGLVDPLVLSGLISDAGAFFGLALGGIILWQRGWFNAGGPALHRLARYIIGLLGVLVLWYGLGAIFPRGEAWLPYVLRYLRYTLVGLWISGLAPLLFIRLKLGQAQK